MKPKNTLRNFLALAGSSLLAVSSTHAGTLYFDGGTTDIAGNGNGASNAPNAVSTWDTTIKNWDAGVGNPYVAWNNANNDNAVIAGVNTLTVGVPVTVGTLTATSSGGSRIISGSEITINNGINLGFLAGFSVTAPIKLGSNLAQNWIHNQGGANSSGKSITGGTTLNGHTLTWDTTNAASNNRVTHSNITGTGNIIKDGNGWLGLGGTNTYTGSNTINAGTIDAASSTALGNTNNQLTVNTGGTLNMSNQSLTVGNLTGTGGVITSTHTSGTRTLTIGSGDSGGGNFQGVIENGITGSTTALTKTGNGTITLSGTNTYSGGTTVSDGTLHITSSLASSAVTVQANGALGSYGGLGSRSLGSGLTIEAGGALDLTGATLGANSVDILTLTAGSLTLANLAFEDLVGWDWMNADAGTYELIDGTFAIDFGSTAYLDAGSAYDFGNGKSGYFTSGSLNAVIVAVPEPSTALLGALGLLALLRRRR